MNSNQVSILHKLFDEHENPHGLTWGCVYQRLRKGLTFDEAMSTPKLTSAVTRSHYLKHKNPYNLSWGCVRDRVKRKGMSLDEAMSYPLQRNKASSEARKRKSSSVYIGFINKHDN